MKKIWEEYSNSYVNSNNYDKPLEVIDRVLQLEYQTSFIETWVDFISRNLYNGLNPNYYYYDDQSLINPINTFSTNIIDASYNAIYESITYKLYNDMR